MPKYYRDKAGNKKPIPAGQEGNYTKHRNAMPGSFLGRGKSGTAAGGAGGAVAGFLLGGPLGAVAGALLGGTSGHGIDVQRKAAKDAGREMAAQTESIRGQAAKADIIARDQQAQAEKALQKISKGRVRASNRRVRGGLFGDTSSQEQYAVASRLGG